MYILLYYTLIYQIHIFYHKNIFFMVGFCAWWVKFYLIKFWIFTFIFHIFYSRNISQYNIMALCVGLSFSNTKSEWICKLVGVGLNFSLNPKSKFFFVCFIRFWTLGSLAFRRLHKNPGILTCSKMLFFTILRL